VVEATISNPPQVERRRRISILVFNDAENGSIAGLKVGLMN